MEIKQGYKQTEIGVIPEDWIVKRLAEVADIRSGGTPSTTNPDFWNGAILWGTPTDITALRGRKHLTQTSRTITAQGLKFSSAEIIPPHSIVMTSRATIGECAINLAPLSTNQGFKNFLPFQNFSVDFLYYLLQTKKQDFISLCGGSTFLEINKTQLAAFQMGLPPTKAEQTAIAEALSDADALIESLEQLITKKRNIKQGAMQELLRPKKDWQTKPLGDLAAVEKGVQLHSNEINASGNYIHLNGGISSSGCTDKSNTPANTIAISEGGNSCGYVQFMAEPFWCGGHCYAVSPKGIDNRFLYHLLKSQQSSIMGLRVGSGLPNVQKTRIRAFNLRFPDKSSEQTEIATVLSDMDVEINALEAKRDKARLIKQGMMQELLTGKTRLV